MSLLMVSDSSVRRAVNDWRDSVVELITSSGLSVEIELKLLVHDDSGTFVDSRRSAVLSSMVEGTSEVSLIAIA